jgi:acetyl esterase/lipase
MDYDRAYQNSDFIPNGASYAGRWEADAAAFRDSMGDRASLDIAYGPGERNRFDLFLPEGAPKGLFVFVHGGYWLRFGRDSFSHCAAGAVARGWACALPGYTLGPQARIAAMTREVARAIDAASARVAGPVVVTGHSAGGHLSARMGCAGVPLQAVPLRVVPISPLADLEPMMLTAMNATLGIDDAEADAESPARQPLRAGCAAHVWVGAQERPAFLWHARTLSEAWNCPWTPTPRRHHFDVIEDLADPASALLDICLAT